MPQPKDAHTELDRALKVVKMQTPIPQETPMGRPRKRRLPPVPKELLDGLTPLEKEYFNFFLDSYRADHKQKMTAWAYLCLVQAALEYINLLRVQAKQLQEGQVLTAARQHPGPQVRAWLELAGVTPKQTKNLKDDTEEKEVAALMKKLGA